jgi:hypothetical protein
MYTNIEECHISIIEKKLYIKPEIIHEVELETKAGTPISPTGLYPGFPSDYQP